MDVPNSGRFPSRFFVHYLMCFYMSSSFHSRWFNLSHIVRKRILLFSFMLSDIVPVIVRRSL